MNPDQMLTYLRARPFVPFRLHLSDQQTFDVRHPEMALLTRTTIVVGVPGTDTAQLPDLAHNVALIHVTSVELLPQVASPQG